MDPRQVVKDFVSRWSDEKLAHVAAFKEDGKMSWGNPCGCLIGVDSSEALHTNCRMSDHYSRRIQSDDARIAENAYLNLGGLGSAPEEIAEPVRNRIFGEILREVMDQREAKRLVQAMSDPQVDRLMADIQAVQA